EMKTKPTQYATRTLNSVGIQPDFIICRAEKSLDEPRKRKIATFCNIDSDNVISAPDVDSIYEIPVNFEEENLGNKILKKFNLRPRKKDLKEWRKLLKTINNSSKAVKIGIVGKYFGTGDYILSDSYISVIEAVKHASWHYKLVPEIDWLNAEAYQRDPKKLRELKKYDGIIIPGGFGKRGIKGKIKAIEYVRKNKIPFLGLCYGMQLATVEFARNVAGLKNAHTTEIKANTKYPVIDFMSEQRELVKGKKYGGTMRLGAYPCILTKGSRSLKAYGTNVISERHRHRYEFNNDFREALTKKGLALAGLSPDGKLVEIIELKDHPFFVATQFHPEFKSRPLNPHPLFKSFIKACL
ncbi:MAG TPA: CTP synthase, partial [Patescibacteria group bacterium]